jgi:hypothetical protein
MNLEDGMNTAANKFDKWYQAVNDLCYKRFSLGLEDVRDLPFKDRYDDGYTPSQFFNEYVVSAVTKG